MSTEDHLKELAESAMRQVRQRPGDEDPFDEYSERLISHAPIWFLLAAFIIVLNGASVEALFRFMWGGK